MTNRYEELISKFEIKTAKINCGVSVIASSKW